MNDDSNKLKHVQTMIELFRDSATLRRMYYWLLATLGIPAGLWSLAQVVRALQGAA
jgi:hypothetical protein